LNNAFLDQVDAPKAKWRDPEAEKKGIHPAYRWTGFGRDGLSGQVRRRLAFARCAVPSNVARSQDRRQELEEIIGVGGAEVGILGCLGSERICLHVGISSPGLYQKGEYSRAFDGQGTHIVLGVAQATGPCLPTRAS
jgi:hypothetical protein